MKLEHLIQGYNFNLVNIVNYKEEIKGKSGVLEFSKDIAATYFVDKDNVNSIKIFANSIVESKQLQEQLEHTTLLIKVLLNTIYLLSNISKEEAKCILEKLNLFNGKLINTEYKYMNFKYSVQIVAGMFVFTAIEEDFNIKNDI